MYAAEDTDTSSSAFEICLRSHLEQLLVIREESFLRQELEAVEDQRYVEFATLMAFSAVECQLATHHRAERLAVERRMREVTNLRRWTIRWRS